MTLLVLQMMISSSHSFLHMHNMSTLSMSTPLPPISQQQRIQAVASSVMPKNSVNGITGGGSRLSSSSSSLALLSLASMESSSSSSSSSSSGVTSSLTLTSSLTSNSNTNTNTNHIRSNKQKFLASLDDVTTLNQASKERTSLLNTMISQKVLVDCIKSIKSIKRR